MKIIFDVETTGLDPYSDEILQLSAIDEHGTVLINTYVKPSRKRKWPEAQHVNGISPDKVKDAPHFKAIKKSVQAIFDMADLLIAYNAEFDMSFLMVAGIEFNHVPVFDVMLKFAPIYGEWNDYYGDYKWQKLTTCARYYQYYFRAHDSLEDVKATLHCYNKMTEQYQNSTV